jgi:hypothetical protein
MRDRRSSSTATVDKRRRRTPDDYIDPKTLNPLARSYLREAFPAVASVRSGLANKLSLGCPVRMTV